MSETTVRGWCRRYCFLLPRVFGITYLSLDELLFFGNTPDFNVFSTTNLAVDKLYRIDPIERKATCSNSETSPIIPTPLVPLCSAEHSLRWAFKIVPSGIFTLVHLFSWTDTCVVFWKPVDQMQHTLIAILSKSDGKTSAPTWELYKWVELNVLL